MTFNVENKREVLDFIRRSKTTILMTEIKGI